ncbi:MAG: alpha/beta hydrolase [Hyphomicrobiales bacterium]|nr:alpha/beta hydrolase [Hyphomicrobiales bacterium]
MSGSPRAETVAATGEPAHTTGHVRSDDVDIFYRRFGQPGRAPILIVHGLSYFSYDWIVPASQLAIGREVVAIDMRGFGQSSWSPARDYKLETMGADVVAVLDHLGWPRAVLMGHSFGGRVCLATAGWRPERTAGLILVDFAPDIAPAGRRHVAERIGRQPDVFATIDAAMAYHGYQDVPAASPRRRRWEAFLEQTAAGWRLRRDLAFRDSFKRALDGGQSQPVPAFLWPMLSELEVPALVIRASGSDMFAPETLAKVRDLNPRIDAIELAGSHDLAGDDPDGLVRAVRAFLDRHGAELHAAE